MDSSQDGLTLLQAALLGELRLRGSASADEMRDWLSSMGWSRPGEPESALAELERIGMAGKEGERWTASNTSAIRKS